ncbi:MAG: FadR family transcriptional regulator [Cellulomonas iranensis]|nr:FadR family transcriptional regulator [Cellulomonas iranensis]
MSDMLAGQDEVDVRMVERIVELGLRVGEVLPTESEMAAAMHAGRPQVREALRVLEAFGAVRSRQGARRVWLGFHPDRFGLYLAAVLGVSDRSVEELFEIRHAFEISHVAEVTARMTLAQQDDLRATVAAMTTGARRGQPVHREDEAFHRALFSSVENRVFEGVSAAFWRLHGRLEGGARQQEDLLSVAAMHARILEAVVARDVRLATHELDAHFWGVRRRLDDRAATVPALT